LGAIKPTTGIRYNKGLDRASVWNYQLYYAWLLIRLSA